MSKVIFIDDTGHVEEFNRFILYGANEGEKMARLVSYECTILDKALLSKRLDFNIAESIEKVNGGNEDE